MDPHAQAVKSSLEEGFSPLVLHAQLLWWLLAAVSVLLGIAVVRMSFAWLRALRASWVRRSLGTPLRDMRLESDIRAVAGREVTLAGTLIAGPESHDIYPDGTAVVSDLLGVARPARLWMLFGGNAVELAGPVSVLVGSKERWFAERSLCVGDAIIARGRASCSSAAPDTTSAFRVGAHALRLSPTALRPLSVAFSGRPLRTGGLKFDAFVGGALGVVVWLSGSALASDAAVKSAQLGDGPLTSAEMLGASAPPRLGSSFQALVPGPRSSDARYTSFAGFEMLRTDSCSRTREALLDAGRVALLAELAPRCASPLAIRDAARALLALGRFEAAHDMVRLSPAHELGHTRESDVRLDVQVHLLSGDFEDALLTVRESHDVSWNEATRARWLCVAGALEVLAGRSESGLWVLKRAQHGPAEAECAVLLADATVGEARFGALDAVRRHRGWANVSGALSLEADAMSARPRELRVPVYTQLVLGEALHAPAHTGWLRAAHHALSVHPEPTPVMYMERASLAAELAVYAAATGDVEGARKLSADARNAQNLAAQDALMGTLWIGDEDASKLALLSAAIEARAGNFSEARRWIARGARETTVSNRRFGAPLLRLVDYLDHADNESASGFMPVGLDEGGALTRWLHGRDDRVTERALLLGSHQIVRGRASFAAALARGLGRNPLSLLSPLRLVDLASHWHNRELAADALGDEEAVLEYATRAERFRAALQRRDVALLLEFLASG